MKRTAPLLFALFLAVACGQSETVSSDTAATSDTAASASSGTTATADTAASASSAPTATDSTATDSTGTGSAATASGACGMITAAELNQATGMTFGEGQSTAQQADMSKCTFTATGGQTGSVTIALHQSDASALYNMLPGMATITGNGIGEKAWWSPQVSNFVSVKGGKTLHIAFNGAPAKQEWAEGIARIITPKMLRFTPES
jgi:hypothetical protein